MTDDGILSAYLDDELTVSERTAVDATLAGDDDARRELAEVAEVRTLVRNLPVPALPDGFVDELLAGNDPPADAPPTTAGEVVDLSSARRRRHGPARIAAFAGAVAAAAAIVVAVVVPTPTSGTPALATNVRVHQASTAAAGDPISGLVPLANPVRFGR